MQPWTDEDHLVDFHPLIYLYVPTNTKMSTILPTWPHVLFAIIEPISL